MTGERFKRIREELGFTLRRLAERWGVHNSTVKREEEKNEVRGLYRDAILRVQLSHSQSRMTMEVVTEVPEHIADQLESDLSAFTSVAVRDRISVYNQALQFLKEEGWDEDEILCAASVLRDHSEMSAFQAHQSTHVAAELEDSTEFPDTRPQRFDISEERWEELVVQVRDDDDVAYALVFAARDFIGIDSPLEPQEAEER